MSPHRLEDFLNQTFAIAPSFAPKGDAFAQRIPFEQTGVQLHHVLEVTLVLVSKSNDVVIRMRLLSALVKRPHNLPCPIPRYLRLLLDQIWIAQPTQRDGHRATLARHIRRSPPSDRVARQIHNAILELENHWVHVKDRLTIEVHATLPNDFLHGLLALKSCDSPVQECLTRVGIPIFIAWENFLPPRPPRDALD